MNTAGTKTIETERLILRRYVVEDAEDMYKTWGSDPKVVTFMTWPMHADVSVSKKLLENWVSRYEDEEDRGQTLLTPYKKTLN